MYGRVRINCDDYNLIYARIIVLPATDIEKEDLWNIPKEQAYSSFQFTGVLDYTQINIKVNNMSRNEYFILTDRTDNIDAEKEGKDRFNPDDKEYPFPKYVKPDAYKYSFGNFGVIYKVELQYSDVANLNNYAKNPSINRGTKIRIYPFGHNSARYLTVLIKNDKNWKVKGPVSLSFSESLDTVTNEKNWLTKKYIEFDLKGNEFYFILSGGNCAIYKFVML